MDKPFEFFVLPVLSNVATFVLHSFKYFTLLIVHILGHETGLLLVGKDLTGNNLELNAHCSELATMRSVAFT